MRLFLLSLLTTLTFASCNNHNNTSDLLKEEPYAGLTDSIQDQPNNAELYYRRGALLIENNQPAYAEADLKKAWSIQQNEQYALGVAHALRRRNPDSAIAFLQQASQIIPGSIALQVGLARGYQQKNDLNKALSVCNAILAQHPNQIDALLLKAEILKASQNEKEALTTLETAYAYAPFDAELAHSLAFEYAQSKNPKVLSLTDSLISKDQTGKQAEPYYFKGVYYSNIGNMAEALHYFNQAIQHDYYFLDAYMEKGRLLYEQKNYQQALQTFKLAITVSPTFGDAYYWSGKTKEAMGNKGEAKLDYQRAYGLDNTLREAKEAADKL